MTASNFVTCQRRFAVGWRSPLERNQVANKQGGSQRRAREFAGLISAGWKQPASAAFYAEKPRAQRHVGHLRQLFRHLRINGVLRKPNVSRSQLTAVSLGVRASETVHPTGFEPVTLGSEDRCAIQLRHGCPSGREYGTRRRFATVHPVHSAVLKNNRVPSAVRGSVPIRSGARDVGTACGDTSPSRSNRSKDARFPPPAIPHTASSPRRSAGRSPAAPSTSDSRG